MRELNPHARRHTGLSRACLRFHQWREMVGDAGLEPAFFRFRSEELSVSRVPSRELAWAWSEMENGRMACERIIQSTVTHDLRILIEPVPIGQAISDRKIPLEIA
jgi:hypothetical protein